MQPATRSACWCVPQHVSHARPPPEYSPHVLPSSCAHTLSGGTIRCPSTTIFDTMSHVTLKAGSLVLSKTPMSMPPIEQFSNVNEEILFVVISGPPRMRLGKPRGNGPCAHSGTQLCTIATLIFNCQQLRYTIKWLNEYYGTATWGMDGSVK